MNKIVLDDHLKAKLNGLDKTVEVRDETGRTVGQFVPQEEYLKLFYAFLKTVFTDEEIERGRNSANWHRLDDILRRGGQT
jgi:hypothetical protein